MKEKFVCIPVGLKTRKVLERDRKVISQCLTREFDFVYDRAKGTSIWDIEGRKYLDFAGGVAVANIGHNNPLVKKAILQQLKKGTHAGFADFVAETPVKFAEKLVSFMPKGLDNVFLSNSGTESVEAAFKAAKWHSKKLYTIAFTPCFHGRTMGSLSMTNSRPVQRRRFEPFLPVKHSPYPYPYRWKGNNCGSEALNELEKTVKKCKGNVSSIFFEPVSGEGGYVVPPKEFVKGLRKLCTEKDILLVSDEIQAGCYRTGEFLSISNFGVNPDIVCMSKAIGGGLPLGATIASKKVFNWNKGSHANTFGGNLLATAAGSASLEFMRKERLGIKAKKLGKTALKELKELEESSIVGEVRGIGLMIGVEIVKDKKSKKFAVKERERILCKAAQKGLLLIPAGESTIRLCPPLTISKQELVKGINILKESIKKVEEE